MARYVSTFRTHIQAAYQRTVPVPLQQAPYRTSVPYFLAKIEAYRTYLPYRTAILDLFVFYFENISK